ncbi:ABC transporter substrate-binding protein [Pararhodobacter oceanensis]|uniref:Nitrate ABC transporter substrate-binding protein n=1 Tax=Pararhodobacter oceanensis TaxID=2172121 RepID=A0A2T8HQ44_9RHOB|nr:ABC transporter substrate-binding protein [Pararhodobacter oceanensis]PVH27568.1 nitrate ABC transporter substrate-binding protein [Pararhodobacter oceanensis]
MTLKIRLAVRDWDYLTPLILGDVSSGALSVEVDRVSTMPVTIGGSSPYNAGEASFSRHLTGLAQGETGTVAVPNFLMRGFRHGCIITRKDSPLTTIEDLAGKRIGVTGWQDSGNTWTRAILRHAGIMTDDVSWYAGRLTAEHPIQDRLGAFHQPGRIEAMPDEEPMMDSLSRGWLDAVFTPFMPSGFFEPESQFRQLLPDCRAAQVAYFYSVGYVPGIHILTVDQELVEAEPWVPQVLSDLIDCSREMWTAKRRRYADTTPFMLDEMLHTARSLPASWDASGIEANRKMTSDFIGQMYDQAILPKLLSVEDVFGAAEEARKIA